jgi:hypothetical protein
MIMNVIPLGDRKLVAFEERQGSMFGEILKNRLRNPDRGWKIARMLRRLKDYAEQIRKCDMVINGPRERGFELLGDERTEIAL